MSNVVNDLSTLTTIPVASLDRLVDLSSAVICHSVEESLLDNEVVTAVEIGIGTLYIKLEDNTVLYKFIPSLKLESSIKETVTKGKSPLVAKVESSLKDKIMKTYKDFI